MTLYICATPLGNLYDVTVRTLRTMRSVSFILCEDTRISAKLMRAYGMKKELICYNDHTAEGRIPWVVEQLSSGVKIALISDAGMPTISDPGYKLVQACYEAGIRVVVEPGASAVLTGLVMSNFPPYPFCFGGFFDPKTFSQFASLPMTLVFFESPRRLLATLSFLEQAHRKVAVVREMTKMYEEVKRGTPAEVLSHYQKHPPRGEITLCLSPPEEVILSQEEIDQFLLDLMKEESSPKRIAQLASIPLSCPVKILYRRVLELKK